MVLNEFKKKKKKLNKKSILSRYPALFYLNYVQFWQQVAVCKSELISVKESSVGQLQLLHAACVNLVGQGVVQVVVQLIQGSGQTVLQT